MVKRDGTNAETGRLPSGAAEKQAAPAPRLKALSSARVAITPDGTRAYVANGTVSVIDTATNTVVATTDNRVLASIAVAITPDGTRAYATNAGNGFNNIPKGASVIDTATNTVVTNIPIPVTGLPIAITHHRAVAKGSEVSKVGMLTFDTKDEIIISSSGSQFWPQTRRGSRPYPHLFILHSF